MDEDRISHAQEWADDLVTKLRSLANADNVAGMARFGISSVGTLGVSMVELRGLASQVTKATKRDPETRHAVAVRLWDSGVHEARIMSALLAVAESIDTDTARSWLAQVDSWDVCDQLCGNLLWRTPYAWQVPALWSAAEETFVKRAAFVVIAQLAVKDKRADDERFRPLLRLVEKQCVDERNDVKKGVNWALRQVGKRSRFCHEMAVTCAEEILSTHHDSAPARWIARDALRELRSPAVLARLSL